MATLRFLLMLPLMLSCAGFLHADDQSAAIESKLREALRNAMLQARDAQNQVVTQQAQQAQSDKDNADLKAQLLALNGRIADLTKQSATDKATSDAAIDGLKSQVTDLTGQIGAFTTSLEAWKKDDAEKTALAANKEAARAELAGQVITLQRLVDAREAENMKLFATGNEILTRYEQYGLGEALEAKEPFTGIARVKLQEQVQDYRDKLLDHVITPTPSGAASPQALARQSSPGKSL